MLVGATGLVNIIIIVVIFHIRVVTSTNVSSNGGRMSLFENILFMLSTKEEKRLQITFSKSLFQKISGYIKVKVTEEDLYLV